MRLLTENETLCLRPIVPDKILSKKGTLHRKPSMFFFYYFSSTVIHQALGKKPSWRMLYFKYHAQDYALVQRSKYRNANALLVWKKQCSYLNTRYTIRRKHNKCGQRTCVIAIKSWTVSEELQETGNRFYCTISADIAVTSATRQQIALPIYAINCNK